MPGVAPDPDVVKKSDEAWGGAGCLAEALRFFKLHVAVGVETLMQARAHEVASTKKRVKALVVQINSEKDTIDKLSTGSGASNDQVISICSAPWGFSLH